MRKILVALCYCVLITWSSLAKADLADGSYQGPLFDYALTAYDGFNGNVTYLLLHQKLRRSLYFRKHYSKRLLRSWTFLARSCPRPAVR